MGLDQRHACASGHHALDPLGDGTPDEPSGVAHDSPRQWCLDRVRSELPEALAKVGRMCGLLPPWQSMRHAKKLAHSPYRAIELSRSPAATIAPSHVGARTVCPDTASGAVRLPPLGVWAPTRTCTKSAGLKVLDLTRLDRADSVLGMAKCARQGWLLCQRLRVLGPATSGQRRQQSPGLDHWV